MPRWPDEEYEILHRLYPGGGSRAVHAALPHRTMGTIKVVPFKRGLKTVVGVGGLKRFTEDMVIGARKKDRWSTARSAAALGCSTATVYRVHKEYRARRVEEARRAKESFSLGRIERIFTPKDGGPKLTFDVVPESLSIVQKTEFGGGRVNTTELRVVDGQAVIEALYCDGSRKQWSVPR